jgi:hypothetical protein
MRTNAPKIITASTHAPTLRNALQDARAWAEDCPDCGGCGLGMHVFTLCEACNGTGLRSP